VPEGGTSGFISPSLRSFATFGCEDRLLERVSLKRGCGVAIEGPIAQLRTRKSKYLVDYIKKIMDRTREQLGHAGKGFYRPYRYKVD